MVKKINKIFLIVWIILTVSLLGLVIYQFGWIRVRDDIYRKGLTDNTTLILKDFTQQLIKNGAIQIPIIVNQSNMPDINGTGTAIGIFIIKPQAEE